MIIYATDGDTHNVLGTAATIKLAGEDTNSRLGVVLHDVPEGAGPPPHVHDSADELLYVLQGTFDFILEDPHTWQHAGPGTLVHIPAGMLHTSRATSQSARLLSVYTPGDDAAFFRDIDTIDQSDIGAVIALAQRHGMTFPTAAAS